MAEKHSTVAPVSPDGSVPAVDAHPQRPGLDGIDPANLPDGVRIPVDRSDCIAYVGGDSALIAGGIIRHEWIVGLGRLTRRIVLDADGAYVIVGEGMRGALAGVQREHGAYGVRRNHDGSLRVDCYRTCSEERERRMADRKERDAESERDIWVRTKAAHSVTDFAERWKYGVLAHLDQVTGIVDGRIRFDNFPDIKVSSQEREAVRLAAAELRRVIAAILPKLDDVESAPANNVIVLRRNGHRLLRDMH